MNGNTSLSSHTKTLVKKILLFSLILISGMIIGSGLTLRFLLNHVHYYLNHTEEAPTRITNRMERILDLKPEQKQAVQEIMDRTFTHFQDIRRSVQPEVESELNQVQTDVESVLDERQAKIWNQHFDKLRKIWQATIPSATTTQEQIHPPNQPE